MNFVSSADGAVTIGGLSAPLSNAVDKRVFRALRHLCDAILVGAGTARVEQYDGLPLTQQRRDIRQKQGFSPDPTLVIASRRLELDPDSALFSTAAVRPVVLTHASSPLIRRKNLSAVAEVLVAGESDVDFQAALPMLAHLGLKRVLCEGGPHLFGSLSLANVVDELCLTTSPLLAGPGAGRIVAGEQHLREPQHMRLAHALLGGDNTLLLRYVRAIPDHAR